MEKAGKEAMSMVVQCDMCGRIKKEFDGWRAVDIDGEPMPTLCPGCCNEIKGWFDKRKRAASDTTR